ALGLAPEQEPIARMSPEPVPERIARALQVAAVPRPGREPSTATVRDVAPDGPAPHIVVEAADDAPAARAPAARHAPRSRTARHLAPDGPAAQLVGEPADESPAALAPAATHAERIRPALRAAALGAPLPRIAVEICVPDPQEPS